jgi:flagellar biosynthesis GTPase FlhF
VKTHLLKKNAGLRTECGVRAQVPLTTRSERVTCLRCVAVLSRREARIVAMRVRRAERARRVKAAREAERAAARAVVAARMSDPGYAEVRRRRAEAGRVRRAAAQAERAAYAEERRLRAEAAARARTEFEEARTRRRARAEVLQAEMAEAIASRTEGGGGSESLESYTCVMCREWPAEMWVSFGAGITGPACVICAVPRECVTVPAFEDMTNGTRRRHLTIRHVGVEAGAYRHQVAHERGKDQDHMHLDPEAETRVRRCGVGELGNYARYSRR